MTQLDEGRLWVVKFKAGRVFTAGRATPPGVSACRARWGAGTPASQAREGTGKGEPFEHR